MKSDIDNRDFQIYGKILSQRGSCGFEGAVVCCLHGQKEKAHGLQRIFDYKDKGLSIAGRNVGRNDGAGVSAVREESLIQKDRILLEKVVWCGKVVRGSGRSGTVGNDREKKRDDCGVRRGVLDVGFR